jgi:4-hydroxybenzoate polyprenyltransferase/phosphoserine phosphatase
VERIGRAAVDSPPRVTRAPAAQGRIGRPEHVEGLPLAVGLDGTLVRGHLARDSALSLLPRALRRAPALMAGLRRAWRAGGRAGVKARLATLAPPDPATLPYRAETLELIREARAAGRPVILVTAADRRLAEAVAAYLGVFDEVHASDGRGDLSGEAKAALLVSRFGEGGFDYAGDSPRDLPVWAAARQGVTVGAPRALARSVERIAAARMREGRPSAPPVHLAPPPSGAARLRPWIEAVRPEQWLKNLLVLFPLLAEHRMDAEGWSAALLTLTAFCLVASAAYVTSDLFDLEAQRADPRRRDRPFASGALTPLAGATLAPALLAAGLAVAWQVSPLVLGVIAFHFGASTLYALVLRRELVIDVCTRAGLYALRVIAGAVAVDTSPSPWMLAFSAFLFLAVAATGRVSELAALTSRRGRSPAASSRPGLGRAARRQAAGRAYRPEDRPVVTMMAVAAGYTAVLVLSLYIYTPGVQALYHSPLLLWGAPAILLYWVSRLVMIAHRGGMGRDPILFSLGDPISWLCAAGVLLSAAAATTL